jgi:hypothetical protein
MAKTRSSRTKKGEVPRKLLGKARVRKSGGIVMGGKLYKPGDLYPIYEDEVERIAKMYGHFVWETLPYEVRERVVK